MAVMVFVSRVFLWINLCILFLAGCSMSKDHLILPTSSFSPKRDQNENSQDPELLIQGWRAGGVRFCRVSGFVDLGDSEAVLFPRQAVFLKRPVYQDSLLLKKDSD